MTDIDGPQFREKSAPAGHAQFLVSQRRREGVACDAVVRDVDDPEVGVAPVSVRGEGSERIVGEIEVNERRQLE